MRLSVGPFNTVEDVRAAVAAMRDIAAEVMGSAHAANAPQRHSAKS
jgi:hypothetical protein